MTFRLRIRGRDYVEPSIAANSANPLNLAEQEPDLPAMAANDETSRDLTRYTISRLATLAGPAIEKAKPHTCLSDADHIRANEYHRHHFGCKTCCAAGQLRGQRCVVGLDFWIAYQGEEPK